MPCIPLLTPACLIDPILSGTGGAVAGGVLGAIAAAIQAGVAWIVTGTMDWWVKIASPNLAAEPAVGQLQQWLLPITAAVAVLSMIIAGGKMALTRKASPLVDVGSGLVIIAVTTAIGVLLPTLLLQAGDAWSSWVLNASSGGQFAARLTTIMELTGAPSAIVVVLGIVAIILSAIQAVLMLFRQASLVVLAGVLPLAAAGTLSPGTRTWFRKVTSWMLALIFYNPAVAAVYATAFTMIGKGGSVQTILMGFAMMLLSLVALPALMKFFTWTTGTVADSAGGGGFLQTAMGGAIAVGALRSYSGAGGAAADQARTVTDQLGPSSAAPSGAASPGGGTAMTAGGQGAGPVPAGVASGSAGGMSGAGAGAATGATAAGSAGAAAGGAAAAGARSAASAAAGAMRPPSEKG